MNNKNKKISSLLIKLFKHFEKYNINYCLLRNYDFLYDFSEDIDNDIDILISANDFTSACMIIKNNGFLKSRGSGELKNASYFYCFRDLTIISLDIKIGDMHWNDITYFPGTIILKRKQKYNDIYIPDKECTLISIVLHSILDKKFFKQKYIEIIKEILSDEDLNQPYVQTLLSKLYSHRIQKMIIEMSRAETYDSLLLIRKNLVGWRIIKNPLNIFLLIRNLLYRKIYKKIARIWQKAPFFSIIGPDGSGKSTVLQSVSTKLQELGYSTKIIYMGRWRDHVLPLANIAKNIQINSSSNAVKKDDITRPKNSNNLYLFIRQLVYILEYYLRYWFRIYPLRKKKIISLTDRYAYDLALDSQNVFNPMVIFGHLYPKPTTVFYLYNTAEELYKRKSEQSISELNLQMSQYFEMAKKKNWFSIKNDHLDDTLSTIMQQILESVSK